MGSEESYFPVAISAAVSFFTMMVSYYFYGVAQKPKVYTSNEKLEKFLRSHVTSVNQKFYPNAFIWEGRLQSIFGLKLRLPNSHKLPYSREILRMKDGGEIGLDFLEPENVDQNTLVVFILPGLTSSSQTCYVKTLVLSITSKGAIAAVLNNRGLGGVPVKTPRMYSASNYEDVQEVIWYLKKKYPDNPKIAIGTSMGGMVLCKYLTNQPEEAKNTFLTALVISACWDALSGIKSLEKPIINKYIINGGMTRNLQHLARKYRKVLEVRECFDFNKILGSATLREFDSNFTAPQFGFKTVQDYYLDATILNVVSKFSIPVFGFNAEDDPMSPGDSLPKAQALELGSKLALVTTVRGGHLGYLEGWLPTRRNEHYMERFAAEFVGAVMNYGQELLI
ncbi:unnamed protein product [Allacma fusca]|uniref:Serine aminopeptidase S33 domain-containing protein n=1 Tax=Allacma fusca TaxID=39272 RepID=A0A8J2LIU6_9HEXA|nr:unnamed protein product [Allacma fusca]